VDAEAEFTRVVGAIANPIIEGVPAGGEENFVTLREVGEKATFDFEPRDHAEIGELLGAIDIARGVKVSGSRFYFLKGVGARLELALLNMALDKALAEGFTPLITPTLVRPEIMAGTGFLGEHADEIYYLPADDLYLTGTSEVALAGYHSNEILDVTEPVRYAGWSTCYRREAGSAGKDNRGILRVHQFQKLEMFSYVLPEEAEAEHARLVSFQEAMLQACELSYRVIDVAAGDLGSSAARKYDIEAWVPTQGAYRELTSTSNCTTYQARRLDIRYRTESGKTTAVATLNGTLATTRWIVAILETHQRADGSVRVPAALRPYLGGLESFEVPA
jgi:seryl-tRNA synthetase